MPVKIISNGILNSKSIRKHTPTQDEIFLLLRNKGIRTLGEIETAYLERDGSVSVFKFPAEKQKPGLPTISEAMIKELNLAKQVQRSKAQVITLAIKQVILTGWKKGVHSGL